MRSTRRALPSCAGRGPGCPPPLRASLSRFGLNASPGVARRAVWRETPAACVLLGSFKRVCGCLGPVVLLGDGTSRPFLFPPLRRAQRRARGPACARTTTAWSRTGMSRAPRGVSIAGGTFPALTAGALPEGREAVGGTRGLWLRIGVQTPRWDRAFPRLAGIYLGLSQERCSPGLHLPFPPVCGSLCASPRLLGGEPLP